MSKTLESEAKRQRDRNARLRREVIEGYGGACACCGETTPEFLGIDHVHGRKGDKRTGHKLYPWLIRLGFPPEYRLLCHNCNLSLGHWGYCPHGGVEPNADGRRSGVRGVTVT